MFSKRQIQIAVNSFIMAIVDIFIIATRHKTNPDLSVNSFCDMFGFVIYLKYIIKAKPSPNGNGFAFNLFGDPCGNRALGCAHG